MPFTFKLSQRLARMRCTAVILATAALAACEKPVALTDISHTAPQVIVFPRTVTLRTNQLVDMMAVGITATGDTAPVSVSWSVTSGSVIDTSTNGGRHYGRYKAGSDTGKVKVIARGNPGGSSDTAVVTVTAAPVAAVTISPAWTSALVGQTVQLAATTLDSAGNVLTGRAVSWSSSNSSIATVSGSGLVTGVAAGSATIIAESEGQSGTASVSVSNVPVASVTVSPTAASLIVGGTQQLSATPKDANGNVLSGRTITWTSNNSGVATVNASGLVGGVAAGSATVTATSEGKSGTATITVTAAPPPPPPPPSAVTDLAVAGVTDSSATVSFTEVNDGTGQPAKYDVRFATGTISWGSATEVTRGSCSTPVSGTTIGARRTCTVLGLSSSTAYGFQLVAYRGTLGVDAVFGALSNAVTATTAAGAPKPVATVTMSPATASVLVGATQQFIATLRDANGTVLTGRTVTWTSSALTVATVSTGGLASALLAGTATITATSEGKSGTATLTVTAQPPVSGGWGHEPAGFTVLTDYGLTDAIPVTQGEVAIPGGSGWSSIYNGAGNVTEVADATAPLSGGSVWQFRYPAGFGGGEAPATEFFNHAAAREVYAGFWWKPSSPWQNHPSSNVNKIAFWFGGGGGQSIDIQMYGPAPYYLHVVTEFPSGFRLRPNVTATPVTLGQWHKIEWHIKYASSAGSGDGVVEWWLDGVLQGSYSNVQTPGDAGFTMFQFSPTWGGVGDTKSETDYYWFDHVHLSRR